MMEQNLAEFRHEWVSRCGSGQELAGRSIRLISAYPELDDALCAIFRAHGASVCEDGKTLVALDTVPSRENLSVLLVCTEKMLPAQDGWTVLHAPAIYGAGLPEGCGCNDRMLGQEAVKAVHCTQLFAAILGALANYRPGTVTVPDDDPHRDAEVRILRLLQAHPTRRFYDDTSYGGQLRKLQLTQLECLLELDRICKEHGIRYFLGGGTLLGAVRHKGFIPWDDDIDVMMPREDFDRFAKIAPQAIGNGYFYQDCVTDREYHSPFTKIRKNGTRFATAFSSRFAHTHNGVFLDIFAHDAAPKSKILLKFHIFLTRFARSMVFHKWEDSPMHFYGKLKLMCRVAEWIKQRCTMTQLEAFQKWVMTFWNRKHTGWLYDGMGEHLSHGRFPAALLEESVEAEFEGHLFPIPKRYDEYLRFSYGDSYMCWPRPAQRNSHHVAVEFSLNGELE